MAGAPGESPEVKVEEMRAEDPIPDAGPTPEQLSGEAPTIMLKPGPQSEAFFRLQLLEMAERACQSHGDRHYYSVAELLAWAKMMQDFVNGVESSDPIDQLVNNFGWYFTGVPGDDTTFGLFSSRNNAEVWLETDGDSEYIAEPPTKEDR